MTLADEIWVAVALLQREQPNPPDFSVSAIIDRAIREFPCRQGMQQHAYQHCVAQRAPNPPSSNHRVLTETSRGRRRLFRPGDSFHAARASGKTVPRREDLPEKYRDLLDWYNDDYLGRFDGRNGGPRTAGSATELLRKFAGCLSKSEAEEMLKAISDFERVDVDD